MEDAPHKYYRWDEGTSRFIETTADDPQRIVYQSELPGLVAHQAARSLGLMILLVGGTLLVRHLWSRKK